MFKIEGCLKDVGILRVSGRCVWWVCLVGFRKVSESRFLRELANQVRRQVWRQKKEDLHKNSRAFVAKYEFNSFL